MVERVTSGILADCGGKGDSLQQPGLATALLAGAGARVLSRSITPDLFILQFQPSMRI